MSLGKTVGSFGCQAFRVLQWLVGLGVISAKFSAAHAQPRPNYSVWSVTFSIRLASGSRSGRSSSPVASPPVSPQTSLPSPNAETVSDRRGPAGSFAGQSAEVGNALVDGTPLTTIIDDACSLARRDTSTGGESKS